MAGLDKRVATYQGMLEGLTDNMMPLAGGLGLCGIPKNLITEARRREVQGFTIVSNSCDVDGSGLSVLPETRQVCKVVASYVGEGALFERQMPSGELEAILAPQDTLVEQLRTGGAGIPAFFTVVGYGTSVVEGKEVCEFTGRPYTLEQTVTGNFALVKGWKADWYSNVIYHHTAQNLNPLMTAVGHITVVEVEEIVPPGGLDPAAIYTPGIFVNRIIQGQFEKRIKQRTLHQKGT